MCTNTTIIRDYYYATLSTISVSAPMIVPELLKSPRNYRFLSTTLPEFYHINRATVKHIIVSPYIVLTQGNGLPILSTI
jgi:hypothetical protein